MTTAPGPVRAVAGAQAPDEPLHAVLPPLILGTATFNTQYIHDPHSMPYTQIVSRALELGVNAFDTSPYYGPSETLLGMALDALANPKPTASNPKPSAIARSSYRLLTKAGRISGAGDEFDYSPEYIRYSVLRSLRRLHTPYLDLVYTHDVEFVSPAEVLAAVRELRRLRDEDGLVRYVGISGYPVPVLCDLAEMIYRETGEGVDAVMSYCHFTVQNRTLGMPEVEADWSDKSSPLARLKAAGVGVVLNASMLGMGLLTSRGISPDPEVKEGEESSPLAKWHPSPPDLRLACKELAELAAADGERLESVSIRWSLEEFARIGARAGTGVGPSGARIGPSVMGVTSVAELEETVAEWRGAVSALAPLADPESSKGKYGAARSVKIANLVRKKLWPALGGRIDYSWASPNEGWVNKRRDEDRGVAPKDDGVLASYEEAKRRVRQSALPLEVSKSLAVSVTPVSVETVATTITV
ncbi:Aldo/keto reductase [Thozetella sp. PMI_491]|nr:Aldo/keto reductase [Thozetella sp. PMI_491]